ncbi:DUF916 domain-containing protein, partial [Cellulomonas wangsupingiae]
PAGTPGGVTWSVEPADAAGPDGRVSLRHVVDPGGAVSDHVTVRNFSDRAASFTLYPHDGVVNEEGAFDVLPGDEPVTRAGAWITLGTVAGAQVVGDGRLLLEVPAASAVVVPLEVAVPDDATPGDHAAGVVAELAPADGQAVRVASRVGVRLHLRVSGDVVASLVPRDVRATWRPSWNPFARGTVRVTYVVGNAGNVRLGAGTRTTLGGPFGVGGSAAATEDVREILPGGSTTVTADLAAWPLVRSAGRVEVVPATVGQDRVDVPLPVARASYAAWTLPWAQLALVLLVGGGAVLVRWWRRRAAAGVQARIDAAVARALVDGRGGVDAVDAADGLPVGGAGGAATATRPPDRPTI